MALLEIEDGWDGEMATEDLGDGRVWCWWRNKDGTWRPGHWSLAIEVGGSEVLGVRLETATVLALRCALPMHGVGGYWNRVWDCRTPESPKG